MNKIHTNSRRAHTEERAKLSAREKLILRFLRGDQQPRTDRQVMSALGFDEPNSVRPRISELIDRGLLTEAGSVICKDTKKRVRLVQAMEV